MSKIYEDCELCHGTGCVQWVRYNVPEEKCQLCAMRSRLEQAQKRITELENIEAAAKKSYQALREYSDAVKLERDAFAKTAERSLHIAEKWRSKAAIIECEKLDEKRRANKAESELAAVVEGRKASAK